MRNTSFDIMYIVIFNASHTEEHPYEKIYDIFETEYGFKNFEIQGDRKVLTPTTTLIGENSKYKTAEELSQAIRDRFYPEDIVFDRLLVTKTSDYSLVG